jgi:hypothetical protein
MDRNRTLDLIEELKKQTLRMELLIEEGDTGSIVETRTPLKEAFGALAKLRDQLQSSQPNFMNVEDVRARLLDYSDHAVVEVCVRSEDTGEGDPGVGAFYLIKSITDLTGTSPTVPVIDLGECISC